MRQPWEHCGDKREGPGTNGDRTGRPTPGTGELEREQDRDREGGEKVGEGKKG